MPCSSEPISDERAVLEVLRLYQHRWRIEEFHKAWKSGAGVERRRMRTVLNIQRIAVILAISTLAAAILLLGLWFVTNGAFDSKNGDYVAVKEVKVECGSDAARDALVAETGLSLADPKVRQTVALANKETLVVAGEMITRLVREHGATLLPIDSEHSAILQCLAGERDHHVDRLILTASGGPFLNLPKSAFGDVTVDRSRQVADDGDPAEIEPETFAKHGRGVYRKNRRLGIGM